MAEEKVTQGERAWDSLPLPEGWPTSWPLAFPPDYADPPSGKTGMIRNDVERAEAEGWRVLTVERARGAGSIDTAAERVRAYLAAEHPHAVVPGATQWWELTITDEVGNAWLLVDARPQMPYEAGAVPGELQFAVFRETGALHRCIAGEVQDPALEVEV